MKKWFCIALSVFLLSSLLFGVGSYLLNSALDAKRREPLNVALELWHSEQLTLELTVGRLLLLIGFVLIWLSLGMAFILGVLLYVRRRRAPGGG